jgi:hypothetical protein
MKLVLPVIHFERSFGTDGKLGPEWKSPEIMAYELRQMLETCDPDAAVQLLRGPDREDRIVGSLLACRGVLKATSGDDNQLHADSFHGEDCISVELVGDPYLIRAMAPLAMVPQLSAFNNQMVTTYGVCRWHPPYKPGSGADVELALRVLALYSD